MMIWRTAMVAGAAFLAGAALEQLEAEVSPRAVQVLGQINSGKWGLREHDTGRLEHLCLGERRNAIQLRHRNVACDWVVLEDTPSSATVQYTCRGHGYGRTHIRRESAQLVQMETQGIVDGVPFDERVEARHVGDCTP